MQSLSVQPVHCSGVFSYVSWLGFSDLSGNSCWDIPYFLCAPLSISCGKCDFFVLCTQINISVFEWSQIRWFQWASVRFPSDERDKPLFNVSSLLFMTLLPCHFEIFSYSTWFPVSWVYRTYYCPNFPLSPMDPLSQVFRFALKCCPYSSHVRESTV